MPDPNGVPGGGVPQQPYNYQQPQPAQNNYQQPQQPWTQQPQQPQYNYQQPQRPQQYNYQQPQPQQPYGTRQQPQQPQYGYQQPQYGYQPVPPSPYGIQRQAAPAVTHKKAIGSMIMMFIALTLLAYPLSTFLIRNFSNAFRGGTTYTWLVLIGHLNLAVGIVLMLVGAIIGSRGHALFGVGILLCLVCALVKRIYYVVDRIDYFEEIGVVMLLLGLILVIGMILAGIGCLARVKALKIVGGILTLMNFILVRLLFFGFTAEQTGTNPIDLEDVLYLFGCVFLCVAILVFPIRKPKN